MVSCERSEPDTDPVRAERSNHFSMFPHTPCSPTDVTGTTQFYVCFPPFIETSAFVPTRRERLKSALYLRLKKRNRLFFKKNLKFLIFFFQKMSHSAKKM